MYAQIKDKQKLFIYSACMSQDMLNYLLIFQPLEAAETWYIEAA